MSEKDLKQGVLDKLAKELGREDWRELMNKWDRTIGANYGAVNRAVDIALEKQLKDLDKAIEEQLSVQWEVGKCGRNEALKHFSKRLRERLGLLK